jgi:cob(I)alamin adenosyltransferase
VTRRRRDEPVTLSRIYTRTGDAGDTHLGDLSRVSKVDERIVAFGTVDELNSWVGLALAEGLPDEMHAPLGLIQNELFDLGADLSVPFAVEGRLRVTAEQVASLEALCDRFNERLPVLKSFVLPGGAPAAARLHVARAVCRRAEREAIAADRAHGVNPNALTYLNRLSDLLFILARCANAGREEPLWKPGGSS